MGKNLRFKKVMTTLGTFLIIGVITYGFLSLVNWSLGFGEWNGFSRFILGAVGIAYLIRIFDEI